VADLIWRPGIQQDEKIGYSPVAGFLTESMIVRKARRGQVICLHPDSPRAWMLRRFFVLISELANDWLISCLRGSFEKDGTLTHMVTAFNNHLRGE
jgi:hypothetical protein